MNPSGEGLLLISPHLDDAVFSCGTLLASVPGATVLTVFAGFPPVEHPLTDWDRRCGFRQGDAIMALRRAEDLNALTLLHAQPLWLDFLDAQYAPSPPVDVIANALHEVVRQRQPETLLFPLGLFHSDHTLVHDAVLKLLSHVDLVTAVYEDALYRQVDDLLQQRLLSLRQAGWCTTVEPIPASAQARALKQRAVHCYRSQLNGLATSGRPGVTDLSAPEQIRRLVFAG